MASRVVNVIQFKWNFKRSLLRTKIDFLYIERGSRFYI